MKIKKEDVQWFLKELIKEKILWFKKYNTINLGDYSEVNSYLMQNQYLIIDDIVFIRFVNTVAWGTNMLNCGQIVGDKILTHRTMIGSLIGYKGETVKAIEKEVGKKLSVMEGKIDYTKLIS